MARKTVIIPEKKEVINNIREKYNNLEMAEGTALKIASLEVTNEILAKAVKVAGVAFVIDLIVPDPVIGIDEALLGAITAATKTANVIITNKIGELAATGTTEMKVEEITRLATSIKNVADLGKSTKKKGLSLVLFIIEN